MWNNDFYPTPENIIAQMTWDLDLNGKTVLEQINEIFYDELG